MGLINEMKQYFIQEKADFIDDEEAVTDFQDLDDRDIDNDGDVDNSDSYLHKRLGTIAKMDESRLELGVDEQYYIEVSIRDARKAQSIINDRADLKKQYKMYGTNVYASDDDNVIIDIKDALDAAGIEIIDSITEESTTANVPGYQTPYAFRKGDKPASEIEILGYKKVPKTNKYFRPMESKSSYKKIMTEMYGIDMSIIPIKESMTLDQAKKEALENSKDGYVQHVNKTPKGYEVSDWYDDKATVASYESGRVLKEAVSYRDYKKDESSTPAKKVNQSIMEVNKMLAEIEKIVYNNVRLKTEMGVNSSQFWKSTGMRFAKINERMTRLSNKLKELSK
jgi:hypothetical protein